MPQVNEFLVGRREAADLARERRGEFPVGKLTERPATRVGRVETDLVAFAVLAKIKRGRGLAAAAASEYLPAEAVLDQVGAKAGRTWMIS